MDIAIYGAQGLALGAYEAMKELIPERRIVCFLVTNQGNNAPTLSGVPVMELERFVNNVDPKAKEDIEILIATPEDDMPDIEEYLNRSGLLCHSRLTSTRWATLMSYYYAKTCDFQPLSAIPAGCRRADTHIFIAKHHLDKPLKGTYELPGWVSSIQAGAETTEKRIAEYNDACGENISFKNKNYSELTALYWIWRNVLTEDGYYGLCHYRRILELSEDDIMRLPDNHVDAVLPYPMPYEPDIGEHHKRYLKQEDWKAVLQAVSEQQPEYSSKFQEILRQKYFYNYNVLLARGDVLDQYCRWLFPILERVEELSVPKGADRGDRYIGYVGETLTTLYFLSNRNRLNIKHTGCRFLV